MMLNGVAAIAGIGATEFSKDSGRSELQLSCEAIVSALADAGIEPEEVDGLSTFTFDNSSEIDILNNIGGKALKFFSRINFGGGGACAPLQQAAMAIATGVAEVVVCYRGMNERSEMRFGSTSLALPSITSDSAIRELSWTNGLRTPAAITAMVLRRYMYETGATQEDFARLAVSSRHYASTNPNARFYGKPITMDDYFASKMIADPFRLFDCCLESDGAVALVVTSAKRARTGQSKPVTILAAAQAATRPQSNVFDFPRKDLLAIPETRLVASQLYQQSGLKPDDVDMGIFYDHISPIVMPVLEAYGFCEKGEAKEFVRAGEMHLDGRLPINTNGGMIGEAYIHGMNGIAEAVRQLRGTAVNQVEGAKVALATSGPMTGTSAVLLGAD